MSPKRGKRMTVRTVRCHDAEWTDALAAADMRDEVLAEEVRKFLIRYGAPARKLRYAEAPNETADAP